MAGAFATFGVTFATIAMLVSGARQATRQPRRPSQPDTSTDQQRHVPKGSPAKPGACGAKGFRMTSTNTPALLRQENPVIELRASIDGKPSNVRRQVRRYLDALIQAGDRGLTSYEYPAASDVGLHLPPAEGRGLHRDGHRGAFRAISRLSCAIR